MAVVFISGTAGRVATGAGSAAIAGIKSWKINKNLVMIPTPHFELVADANGVVWNMVELKGLAGATVDMEGWYDIGTGTEGTLFIGAVLVLDLVFNKTSSFGYLNLNGTLMDIGPGTNVENQAASFSAKVQLTGTVAAAA